MHVGKFRIKNYCNDHKKQKYNKTVDENICVDLSFIKDIDHKICYSRENKYNDNKFNNINRHNTHKMNNNNIPKSDKKDTDVNHMIDILSEFIGIKNATVYDDKTNKVLHDVTFNFDISMSDVLLALNNNMAVGGNVVVPLNNPDDAENKKYIFVIGLSFTNNYITHDNNGKYFIGINKMSKNKEIVEDITRNIMNDNNFDIICDDYYHVYDMFIEYTKNI